MSSFYGDTQRGQLFWNYIRNKYRFTIQAINLFGPTYTICKTRIRVETKRRKSDNTCYTETDFKHSWNGRWHTWKFPTHIMVCRESPGVPSSILDKGPLNTYLYEGVLIESVPNSRFSPIQTEKLLNRASIYL